MSSFFTAYQEALQRLENPSFRIATIGTTSSGKSTIVNALIGRRIAPIADGEMSGGVLTIKHSLEHKLIIAETKDAAWETGEWIGLSDEDIYQRIYTVMISYHEARKKREFIAPQITVYVPTLPSNEFALLGLPQGIEIEFIDLPGLKSVQDRTNLSIIQQQVNKAFSLVSLDYMQIDDDHRRCLLEELKTVVEYLQGRTDSMIFILNRVDQRGADDLPLDVRINKLREEIQEVLSLPKLPDIIPFLILVINSLKEDFIQSLDRQGRIEPNDCDRQYRDTQFLWLGVEELNYADFIVDSQQKQSEYDVYLVTIELEQDHPGFRREARIKWRE